MSKYPVATLTPAQALTRAQGMLTAARKLQNAAEELGDAPRSGEVRDAMEAVKDYHLLNHRVSTAPDVLIPVLEALLKAAAATDTRR